MNLDTVEPGTFRPLRGLTIFVDQAGKFTQFDRPRDDERLGTLGGASEALGRNGRRTDRGRAIGLK